MSKYETELHDFPNIFSLKGKVVVVTGGSRGLGLHAASGYVSPGFLTNPGSHAPASLTAHQIPPSRGLQSLYHLP
jgi:hypothetical protein